MNTPSPWFERFFTFFTTWFVIGLFTDGWAHSHVPELETFFTPWHGIMYSGFFLILGFLLWHWYRSIRSGSPWRSALPKGYGLSLVGAVLFLFAGFGDMIWHEILGIEVGIEALLSPTHLLLAVGAVLMVTGPIRATVKTPLLPHSWLRQLPLILSFTYTLLILSFMTQVFHPLTDVYAADASALQNFYEMNWNAIFQMVGPSLAAVLLVLFLFTRSKQGSILKAASIFALPVLFSHPSLAHSFNVLTDPMTPDVQTSILRELGVASIYLQTILMMGVILYSLKYWRLPAGSYTIMMYLLVVGMSILNDHYAFIPAITIVGIITDLLVSKFHQPENPTSIRTFAFLIPVLFYGAYFGTLAAITAPFAWSVHLWTGAIVVPGLLGLLLSTLSTEKFK